MLLQECVNNTIWVVAKLLKVNLQHLQAVRIAATIAAAAPTNPTEIPMI